MGADMHIKCSMYFTCHQQSTQQNHPNRPISTLYTRKLSGNFLEGKLRRVKCNFPFLNMKKSRHYNVCWKNYKIFKKVSSKLTQ